MTFDITPERKAYLEATGKVVLNACPGSGKTTTIAHKMVQLIRSWNSTGTYQGGISCLSFTNVAKNEIAEKYRETCGFPLSFPHRVSTIDNFINTNITLPFAHKIISIEKRFRIVDDMGYIDKMFMNNWQFLKNFGQLAHKFQPSKIDYTLDLGFSWDGHNKSDNAEFVQYGKAVKELQWKSGLLKTSDSALIALQIMRKFPQVSKYLSTRFPHIIIDEAQDTSEIQHAILDELLKGGLKNLDLVGDPYQCLYQWRDASPDLFLQKFDDTANWKGLYLSENRRSTQKIVSVFSYLRRKGEKPIIAINNAFGDLPVHVLKYEPGRYSTIIPTYEKICKRNSLEKNRVLVRGHTLRCSLLGIPEDFKPWNNSLPHNLIQSKIHLESNEVKEAIRKIKKIIIELANPDLGFQELKLKEEELQSDHAFNGFTLDLIRNLPSFTLSITEWTNQTQEYLKEQIELDTSPDFLIRKRSSKNFDIQSLKNPLTQYFRKATTNNNLPITTVHQVKGMTFDSVLIVLSENSSGQNISLKDLKEPADLPSEKQRLIYVALSRPRKLLCVGVPNTYTDNILRTKFGQDVVII